MKGQLLKGKEDLWGEEQHHREGAAPPSGGRGPTPLLPGGGTRGKGDQHHGEGQLLLQREEGTEVQADISIKWPLE